MEELRITLRNAGKIDPEKIEDYLAVGGYSALEKVKTLPQADVIEEVKKSGLRGRGGAGFNTGLKWEFAFKTAADQKYVVCNADEGEPGTYKDRIIMENDPHALVEGMAICGYATGADKGYIYCRGEYPYVADLLRMTIAQAKVAGKLAGFDIEVRLGAGAYVCGEETALIESIEGRRGEPRFKPPYPGVAGLWGKPTVVNNVETYATLPYIILEGADAFKEIGAPNYPGTKVFTLTGDVQNKTFFELPTDATVRDLIYRFGGGVANGGRLRAVQIGGASGGILPESLLDTKLDFDSMAAVGASLGSGAVFVIDESRDLKEIAESTAHFFQHESCGKCVPCREGTK
ncbi:MAG: NADH-ubiquinone oxidoreductase-F iron-sulfur binding region domain-containing protein, partial [Anaerolineaceae bacterium]|nr:NADH-ubiquinone oxidoreductase-F iron-sulfur binding region domain-containing protein [Anaerolineaceae bacterium]